MKYTGLYKERKWHKHSRIPLAAMLTFSILLAAVFFIIRYRFNRVLEYIVSEESHGKYAFRSEKMNVSLLHKRIIMEKAMLVCLDSTNETSHYDLNIPEIYFSISSWKELLMNKKIVIDSFSIVDPGFSVRVRKRPVERQTRPFRPGTILEYLEQTLQHLNARSLTIRDASITYGWFNDPQPLHVNKINLSLINFTHVNNDDSHLFGSDKVEFSLGRQHWILSDSSREISFRSLSFQSSDQRMEIDSFAYHQWPTEDKSALDIRAEKFFFNSHHIPAIYQKSELLIDTLYCYRPVFSIPGKDPGKAHSQQMMQAVSKAAEPVFRLINIKFIGIEEAELVQTGKDAVNGNIISPRTNLAIYNFTSNPERKPRVTADSIRLSVRQLQFYSADSLFRLDIGEFAFKKDDLLFKNVVFGPSEFNNNPRAMHFSAPSLILHSINLEELTHKHLVASSAELIQPAFTFQDNGKYLTPANPAAHASERKMKGLYQTLHSVQELVSVPDFRISRGRFNYQVSGQLQAVAENINAHLMPDKFFRSDSLVDFKDAIRYFNIGQLSLKSKTMIGSVYGYAFNGIGRLNHSDSFTCRLSNGTSVSGADIRWKSLDWDLLQQAKQFRTDQLSIGTLAVNLKTNNQKSRSGQSLPVLDIRILEIKKAAFTMLGRMHGSTSFVLNDAGLTDVRTDSKGLVWGHARFVMHDFRQEDSNSRISADLFLFDNEGESRISGLKFLSQNENGQTAIQVPLVKASLPLHSSDISHVSVPMLIFEGASADLNPTADRKKSSKPFSMPVDLDLGSMEWNNLRVKYRLHHGRDSTNIQFQARVSAENIKTFRNKEKIAEYHSAAFRLSDLRIDRPGIHDEIPEMELMLKNGKVDQKEYQSPELKSDLAISWKDGVFRYRHDSTEIQSTGVAGSASIPGFKWQSGKPIDPQQLAEKTNFSGGPISYRRKTMRVNARKYSWNGSRRELNLQDFEIRPVLSREESFKKAIWQKDYMEAQGKRLVVSGLYPPEKKGDSLLRIHQLLIDGARLITWRDRRIPFQHGIEKPMPTRLVASLVLPVAIDTIRLHNNEIRVHEYSIGTGFWSDMPIDSLSGYIATIKSRNNDHDRLNISVSARFYRNWIRQFSYSEAYGDTLSSFQASLLMTNANLHHFTGLSMAIADLGIKNGYADTIASIWSGNKYAASGHLHLSFQNLRIKLYNKKDTARWAILPATETGLANIYLSGGRDKTTFLYFERDREKFVFNYWVKTQAQGFLSVLGLKSSRKYLKEYNQYADAYGLERK